MLLGAQGPHFLGEPFFQKNVLSPIPAGHVHVWHLPLENPVGVQHWPGFLATLSLDEQKHLQGLTNPHRQNAYSMTRALCRLVLSHYVPSVPPHAWCFRRNAYGRPALHRPNCALEDVLDLDFNITHTRSHVMVAVAALQHRIGIDLESFANTALRPALIARFFSEAEQAALQALNPEAQARRCVQLWVLKEAYIKARGMGLSIPLPSFTVSVACQAAVDAPWQAVLESAPPGDCAQLWHLELADVLGQHSLALCARRTHAKQGLVVKHCSAQDWLR